MQYLGHAQTLTVKPAPINCMRLVLTGKQPKLEALFSRRFNRLNKQGAFDAENCPERLVDRRPVAMLDASNRTKWLPPKKVRGIDKREGYSNPRLTEGQNELMTAYTRGA